MNTSNVVSIGAYEYEGKVVAVYSNGDTKSLDEVSSGQTRSNNNTRSGKSGQ